MTRHVRILVNLGRCALFGVRQRLRPQGCQERPCLSLFLGCDRPTDGVGSSFSPDAGFANCRAHEASVPPPGFRHRGFDRFGGYALAMLANRSPKSAGASSKLVTPNRDMISRAEG